ncbi:HAD family hydrolase [Roseospira marina]|uniref:HAD family hydrolase n=1 Tax=Roseospira marina TaxID=140057 RepID=A0A5M6IEX2_9PROT|nr:HAD family hydrolase [Roseospira marina]KAA5606289.1 HAD family hydrolase [Roseospira marina]MBB4314447.1 HAD superfamily hydrolase (TIGR01509 family) [Roseospira marina]MBB5087607.1 HAD superfamily hydrolase (TIGR01509 family) [Roseospira marina]
MSQQQAEPVDLVIFDCDGVLVDSEPISTRILLESLTEAGLELTPDEIYSRFLGKSLASITAILRRDHGLRVDAGMLDRMRARLFAAFREELRPMAGMAETLARLPVPFCVASSSLVERMRLALEVTGLLSAFEGRLFSASMVTRGKPAPDLFLYAAEQMGVAPDRCVVVEDSEAGVTAGQSAGMRVFGFVGGTHARLARHRATLAARHPTLMFEDMADLPARLAEHGATRVV